MQPKLRIRNPDLVKNTKMDIRRATSMATINDAVPIFSGDFAKDYTDTAVPANGLYVYLVSLGNDTDGLVPQIPFWFNYRSEWGPFDANLGVQQAVNNCAPAARGNMTLGAMFDVQGITHPTYSTVTNWTTLATTGTGLVAGEVKALVTGGVYSNVSLRGRILRYPYNTENQAQITTAALDVAKAAKALNELTTRLNDPLNTANVYTVSGFRYALRVMDRTLYDLLKESLTMNIAYNPANSRNMNYVFNNVYIAKDDTTLVKLSNNGAPSESEVTTGTVTLSPILYFEYLGPA